MTAGNLEGKLALVTGGTRGIGLGLHRQRMGACAAAIALEQSELTVGKSAEPVLTAIEVPEVEAAIGRAAEAARPKAPKGHAVVGAIIEIAGVAHRVRAIPAETEGPAPARLGRMPGSATRAAAQQRTQSGESERGHAQGPKVAPDCQNYVSSPSSRASSVTAVRTRAW